MKTLLVLLLAMSDSAALIKAKTLWGPNAMIGMRRGTAGYMWTRQVGCYRPGGTPDFIVEGSGLGSWEAAFAAVPVIPAPVPVPVPALDTKWDIGAYEYQKPGAVLPGNKTTSAPVTVTVAGCVRVTP